MITLAELGNDPRAVGAATLGGFIALALYGVWITKKLWTLRIYAFAWNKAFRRQRLLKQIKDFRFRKSARLNGHSLFPIVQQGAGRIVRNLALMILNSGLASLEYQVYLHKNSEVGLYLFWTITFYIMLLAIDCINQSTGFIEDYSDYTHYRIRRRELLTKIAEVSR